MKQGDVVLSCKPFAYAVYSELPIRRTTCDTCLGPPKEECTAHMRCSGCGYVYYCDRKCQREAWPEHKLECKVYKNLLEAGSQLPSDIRLTIRIINKLRRGGDKIVAVLPDGTKRGFYNLVSHKDKFLNGDVNKRNFINVCLVLPYFFSESNGGIPTRELALDVFAKVNINSFAIHDRSTKDIASALYLESSAIDHSCRPNADYSFIGKEMTVRCIKDWVKEFSEVRVHYCDLTLLGKERRDDLRNRYFFDCYCEECSDPNSEIDAYGGPCTKCPHCSGGVPLEKKFDEDIPVICEHCKSTIPRRHLEDYWALRGQVRKALSFSEPGVVGHRYIDSMKALFFPTEREHLNIFNECFRTHQAGEEKALAAGKEVLLAQETIYKKSNGINSNVGILLGVLAGMSLSCQRLEEAESFVNRAIKMLTICFGAEHPMVKSNLSDLKLAICMQKVLKTSPQKRGI